MSSINLHMASLTWCEERKIEYGMVGVFVISNTWPNQRKLIGFILRDNYRFLKCILLRRSLHQILAVVCKLWWLKPQKHRTSALRKLQVAQPHNRAEFNEAQYTRPFNLSPAYVTRDSSGTRISHRIYASSLPLLNCHPLSHRCQDNSKNRLSLNPFPPVPSARQMSSDLAATLYTSNV